MKRKKKFHHTIFQLSDAIDSFQKDVFRPEFNESLYQIPTHSWFSLNATNHPEIPHISKLKAQTDLYFVRKYIFNPTALQKTILESWFKAAIIIYNAALKEIKSVGYHKKDCQEQLSFYDIRTRMEKNKKSILRNINIPTHFLNNSIQKAVSNYKSALTNFRRGNIVKFRIRYYKYKNEKISSLYVDPAYIKKNGSVTRLGDIKMHDIETKEPYNLDNKVIKNEFEIKYYSETNQYIIIIRNIRKPQLNLKMKTDDASEKIKGEFISIDPGIKPFLTGVTKTNTCHILEDNKKIRQEIEKMEKCEKSNLKGTKKKRYMIKKRKRIENLVNDMHWKTIKYLTSNYNKILIGDMSVKGIVGKSSIIFKKLKKIILSYRLYVFKRRLKEKCEERGIAYSEINEYYTSKTCSKCGNYKKDLKLQKEYVCKKCGQKMQRDINGARNIYYVSKIPQKEK